MCCATHVDCRDGCLVFVHCNQAFAADLDIWLCCIHSAWKRGVCNNLAVVTGPEPLPRHDLPGAAGMLSVRQLSCRMCCLVTLMYRQ